MQNRLAQQTIIIALLRMLRLTMLMVPLACVTTLLHSSKTITDLERVKQRGYLQIITVPGPTTYYENAKGQTGFEYLLAKGFAKYLGVSLKVTEVNNLNGVMIALGGPNGDFAAAGLTVTAQRLKQARFSNPYSFTSQELLYKLGTKKPKSFDDLKPQSRLLTIAHSSHSEQIRQLQSELPDTQWGKIQWQEVQLADMLGLMEQVHNGDAEYAVVDSTAHRVNQSIYPNARIAFQVAPDQPIAWAFPNNNDISLLDAANTYLQKAKASGALAELKERFFGHVDKFNIAGSQLFMKRVEQRLPKYLPLLLAVADQYDINWQLLAATAYQESHWNPKAKSPTGVRGLMMLTRPTAKEMGIKNRLDPEQSLDAGARYFLKTKKRLSERIKEPDRTWMALAAYNVGFGHLEDARVLTERAGKDPNRWEDVKLHLPLLEQKKHYSTVKRGFARGREPVSYVQNIRHYQDILQWHSLEQERKAIQKEEQEFADRLTIDMQPSE